MRTTHGALLLALPLALALPLLSARPAEACSCIPPDLPTSYQQSTDVLKVRVYKELVGPSVTRYRARVLETYKGCKPKGALVWLVTNSSSAACGTSFQLGGVYLVTGQATGKAQISVNLCGYNVLYASLPPDEKDWLAHRYVCCGGKCACADGSQPVLCFVDPCEVESCPQGECVSNYCGGCHAEFYSDEGPLVCESCAADQDCAWSQYCAMAEGADSGICLGFCDDAGDCPEGWACGGDGVCFETAGETTWWSTCGYPVCSIGDEPPGDLPPCPPSVEEGGACAHPGEACDDGLGCGSYLLCTDTDPKASGCPKSLRETKTDIEYLAPPALEALAQELLAIPLALWRYKASDPASAPRVGFVIDDVAPSPAVTARGDRVDLYGYLSMAVAALQTQERRIEALEEELRRLRAELERSR